jgi:hypothetical protein
MARAFTMARLRLNEVLLFFSVFLLVVVLVVLPVRLFAILPKRRLFFLVDQSMIYFWERHLLQIDCSRL